MISYFFKRPVKTPVNNPTIIGLLTLGMQCVGAEAHHDHPLPAKEDLGMDPNKALFFSAIFISCAVLALIYNSCKRACEDGDLENKPLR